MECARPTRVREARKRSSPKSVNLFLSVLHDVLKTAKREELIESNAAEGVERPKLEPRRWRILEPAEVSRVHKAFTDEQARTVFLTLVLTGMRRDELRGLHWRDVDLVDNVLRVRDSKSEEGVRSIALSRSRRGSLAASAPLGVPGRRRAGVLPRQAGLASRPRLVHR